MGARRGIEGHDNVDFRTLSGTTMSSIRDVRAECWQFALLRTALLCATLPVVRNARHPLKKRLHGYDDTSRARQPPAVASLNTDPLCFSSELSLLQARTWDEDVWLSLVGAQRSRESPALISRRGGIQLIQAMEA